MLEGYSKNEIARAEEGFLNVDVWMRIISFVEVDDMGQTLKVILEIRREWSDARLTLLHLQEDQDLNVLWQKNYEKIWYPKINLDNIDPSKDSNARYEHYVILRDMNFAPTVQNGGSTNATNEFNGSQHKIVRTREYTNYWRCVYNLHWYPFDQQTCDMQMSLPKHYLDFVRLNPKRIDYNSDSEELTEYSVDKILFCTLSNGTKMVIEVTMSRPLISSVLTIYVPTLLLIVIRYLQKKCLQIVCLEFRNVVAAYLLKCMPMSFLTWLSKSTSLFFLFLPPCELFVFLLF